ncbi:MAG: sulfite exporter TauE/SafE family protein [Planctomycetota bacterium]|jgi:sulfite exporter TauE/SafE
MDGFGWSVLVAALGVAAVHTLLGPDHFLPFVMLGRARSWSTWRTVGVTALCGTGHVLGSVLLGGVGIALGVAVGSLEQVESIRGDLAAWMLLAFGFAYLIWGVRHALRRARGPTVHVHARGDHGHTHRDAPGSRATVLVLFLVFVLGPCEPLIPLFMVPASRGRWGLALAAALLFGVVTIATMVTATLLARTGLRRVPSPLTERWSHALAGAVIAASGAAILTLGL